MRVVSFFIQLQRGHPSNEGGIGRWRLSFLTGKESRCFWHHSAMLLPIFSSFDRPPLLLRSSIVVACFVCHHLTFFGRRLWKQLPIFLLQKKDGKKWNWDGFAGGIRTLLQHPIDNTGTDTGFNKSGNRHSGSTPLRRGGTRSKCRFSEPTSDWLRIFCFYHNFTLFSLLFHPRRFRVWTRRLVTPRAFEGISHAWNQVSTSIHWQNCGCRHPN